jgi:hypothetical protein
MKRYYFFIIILLFSSILFTSCNQRTPKNDTTATASPYIDTPSPPPSANTPVHPATKVWIHYMPWFQTPGSLGGFGGSNWGWHWKMNTQNPNIIDPVTQKRRIAAHYYPLIGPYDSRDPYLIEYHLLLMKYSGVDGILIDWYGTRQVNDYYTNLLNSDALIQKTSDYNLKFGIVYEDWTVEAQTSDLNTRINLAKTDMAYINSNYYSKPNYIKVNNKNLFLIFGPRTFNAASDWTNIMDDTVDKPIILPLIYRKDDVGTDSEFSWVDPNYNSYLTNFYNRTLNVKLGSALPGFHDFYTEGGAGESYPTIDPYGGTKGTARENPGKVFDDTLTIAASKNAPYLQIVTWNDFGEGTMVEPTYEFQFTYLQRLQKFTGVSYGLNELKTIFKLYKARKQYSGDAAVQAQLDICASDLKSGNVSQAQNILNGMTVDMLPYRN